MALSAAIFTIVVAFTMLRPLPAQAATPTFTAAAERIVADTNVFRTAHGLGSVTLDLTISADVAQPWAQKMAQTGSFQHNPNVSAQIPTGWSAWGENIAFGFDYADVVAAWIASPEHRANLLGSYNHLGIGFAVDASGTAWLVQDFASYPKSSTSTGGAGSSTDEGSGVTGTSDSAASTGTTDSPAPTNTSVATRASVSRGDAVVRNGKHRVGLHHLKVRTAGHAGLRVSGSTRAHSAVRVHISGPKGAHTTATVHTKRHGHFAMVWNGSGHVGTYAITVRYLANKHYAPAYTKWTMTFTRTP